MFTFYLSLMWSRIIWLRLNAIVIVGILSFFLAFIFSALILTILFCSSLNSFPGQKVAKHIFHLTQICSEKPKGFHSFKANFERKVNRLFNIMLFLRGNKTRQKKWGLLTTSTILNDNIHTVRSKFWFLATKL